MVGQKAETQPAANPGLDAKASLGCSGNLRGPALTDEFKEVL